MTRGVDVWKVRLSFHDAAADERAGVWLARGDNTLQHRSDEPAGDVYRASFKAVLYRRACGTDVRDLTACHERVMIPLVMGCSSAFLKRTVRRRGYTLLEALIALGVLFILIYVVGDAVSRMLHNTAMSVGRANQSRTVLELAIRMNEEARSSTAVFIPATDVFGGSNSGSAVHEIDFFRKLSAGGDAYVAYTFDATHFTVTRYEYTLSSGAATIVHADQVADGIGSLSASRAAAGSMNDVVSPATVSDVSILYAPEGVAGGNDVVTVQIQGQSSGGGTPSPVVVHLASRAAPTALSILTPAKAPPPAGGVPITIPFIIRGVSFQVPHKPWHSGEPESGGTVGGSGPHLPWVAGALTSFGGASGFSWLDLESVYPVVESGSYTYRDSAGNLDTVTISCDGAPCPRFNPLPHAGSPPAPPGGVGFDAAP